MAHKQKHLVWDLPLRLFHWAFAISVIGSFISGEMEVWAVHERFGMTIIGLVIFRVIWGFIGSETARFSHFLTGPKAVFHTIKGLLRKQSDDKAGHSPVGGYATVALLLVPFFMALTGTINTDDILYDGPFYHLFTSWSKQAGELHEIGHYVVIALFALHMLAIGYYWLAIRKNLVAPMVTGRPRKNATGVAPLSASRVIFGLFLMVGLVGLAQAAILLRPAYF